MTTEKYQGHVEVRKTDTGFHTRAIAENGKHLSGSVEHFTSENAAYGNIRAQLELFGGVCVEVHDHAENPVLPKKCMLYRDGTKQEIIDETIVE